MMERSKRGPDRTPEAEAIVHAIARELAAQPPEGMTTADVQGWLNRRGPDLIGRLASRLPEPTLMCEACGFRASRAIPHYALQRIECPSEGRQFVDYAAYKAQRDEQDRQLREQRASAPSIVYKPSPEAVERRQREEEEKYRKKLARSSRDTYARPVAPYEPYLSVPDRNALVVRRDYHEGMAEWHRKANLLYRRKVEVTAAARHKAAGDTYQRAIDEWDKSPTRTLGERTMKALKRRRDAADDATYKSDGKKKTPLPPLAVAAHKSQLPMPEGGKHHRPLWFASGSSRVPDIEGWAGIGAPIGVSARELTDEAEQAILKLRGRKLPVFVDSGAFSETDERPLGVDDWKKIIGRQTRIATALGEQAYIVAPDRVGNQDVTLERLRTWAEPLRAIRSTGAHVLVAVQKGKDSGALFWHRANAELGFETVPALPSNKAAMTLAEIVKFVEETHPRRLHLLGIGGKNPRINTILTAIREHSPDTDVTLDSNRIVAAVGRKGGKIRKLTAAQDEVRDELLEQCRSGGDVGIGDYTELIGDPALWMTRYELKELASSEKLSKKLTDKWLRDPMQLLAAADDDDMSDEEYRAGVAMQLALERAWARWCVKRVSKRARVHGIQRAFGGGRREAPAATPKQDEPSTADDEAAPERPGCTACGLSFEDPIEAETYYGIDVRTGKDKAFVTYQACCETMQATVEEEGYEAAYGRKIEDPGRSPHPSLQPLVLALPGGRRGLAPRLSRAFHDPRPERLLHRVRDIDRAGPDVRDAQVRHGVLVTPGFVRSPCMRCASRVPRAVFVGATVDRQCVPLRELRLEVAGR